MKSINMETILVCTGQSLMRNVDCACFEPHKSTLLNLYKDNSALTPFGYIPFSDVKFITVDAHILVMKKLVVNGKLKTKYHGIDILISQVAIDFIEKVALDIDKIPANVVPIIQVTIPISVLEQMWKDFIDNRLKGGYTPSEDELSIEDILRIFSGVSFYQQIEIKKTLERDDNGFYGFSFHLHMLGGEKIAESSFGMTTISHNDYIDAIREDLDDE